MWNCQNVSHSRWTILHSHQQNTSVLISPHLSWHVIVFCYYSHPGVCERVISFYFYFTFPQWLMLLNIFSSNFVFLSQGSSRLSPARFFFSIHLSSFPPDAVQYFLSLSSCSSLNRPCSFVPLCICYFQIYIFVYISSDSY